jgi:hypothetical protein
VNTAIETHFSKHVRILLTKFGHEVNSSIILTYASPELQRGPIIPGSDKSNTVGFRFIFKIKSNFIEFRARDEENPQHKAIIPEWGLGRGNASLLPFTSLYFTSSHDNFTADVTGRHLCHCQVTPDVLLFTEAEWTPTALPVCRHGNGKPTVRTGHDLSPCPSLTVCLIYT